MCDGLIFIQLQVNNSLCRVDINIRTPSDQQVRVHTSYVDIVEPSYRYRWWRLIYLRKHKTIFVFSIIFHHWGGTVSWTPGIPLPAGGLGSVRVTVGWNPSSLNTRTNSSCVAGYRRCWCFDGQRSQGISSIGVDNHSVENYSFSTKGINTFAQTPLIPTEALYG